MTTPSEQLRTAAETLRTMAEAATRGPWEAVDQPTDPGFSIVAYFNAEGYLCFASHETWSDDAAFIALMDPTLAGLVADWLEEAIELDKAIEDSYPFVTAPGLLRMRDRALALAEHINGRTA